MSCVSECPASVCTPDTDRPPFEHTHTDRLGVILLYLFLSSFSVVTRFFYTLLTVPVRFVKSLMASRPGQGRQQGSTAAGQDEKDLPCAGESESTNSFPTAAEWPKTL